ncbi:MAG: hypothetical protein IBJ03_00250 [Gemmatimonadaceae bacterium]|nr:hypothetical protein [Gemmatimonadaceae bacterium]
MPLLFRPHRKTRHLSVLLLLLAGGCDRMQSALKAPEGDPVWQGDSTLLASKPNILFRVNRSAKGAQVIPIATFGDKGFRQLVLSDRGWRALDLVSLKSGTSLTTVRGSDLTGNATIQRGMWEGAALDTLAGCRVLVPGPRASILDGVELAILGERPARPNSGALPDGVLARTLETIPTLIAPTNGVPLSTIPRYRRQVFVVPTGATNQPTIVVIYDDPEIVSDTVPLYPPPRPRHFVVVLDKGIYGFKPSHTYTTLGNSKTPPRREFLGAIDTDGDGKAELLFGIRDPRYPLVTMGLRFQVDSWVDAFTYERQRCHG